MEALVGQKENLEFNPVLDGKPVEGLRMGVMWRYFGTPIWILAAQFWMYCSR